MRLTLRRRVAGSRPSVSHHRSATRVELAVAIGADVRGVPAVGVLGGDAQRALLTGAADPDREPLLDRVGQAGGVDGAEVLTLVGRAVLGQEAADQRERLLELVEAPADRREVVPEGLGLLVVPPAPRPSSKRPPEMWSSVVAAFASRPGVPVQDAEDQAADPGPAGVGRQCAERAQRLEVVDRAARGRSLVEVVPHRDPVDPGVVETPPQAPQLGHRRGLLPHVHTQRDGHRCEFLAAHPDGGGRPPWGERRRVLGRI